MITIYKLFEQVIRYIYDASSFVGPRKRQNSEVGVRSKQDPGAQNLYTMYRAEYPLPSDIVPQPNKYPGPPRNAQAW